MTQYNTLNAKLSNSQLKLKSGTKNATEVTLKTSSKFVGDFNDENNFSHKFLLRIQCRHIFAVVTRCYRLQL